MVSTPDLGIPELAQSQANPDVTHNRALIAFQALLNGVIDKDLTSPPGSPVEGDAYLINTASPTGAWAGRAFCIAIYWGTSWYFVPGEDDAGTPITMGSRQEGLSVYVRDENAVYVWRNTATSPASFDWVSQGAGPFFPEADFEEGTWTPNLTFATPGDLSVVYAQRQGEYTRTDNEVIVRFSIVATPTFTTAAGLMQLTGLPFANNSIMSPNVANPIRFSGINKATFSTVHVTIAVSSTILGVRASGMGVAAAAVQAADCTSGAAVTLNGQISYKR